MTSKLRKQTFSKLSIGLSKLKVKVTSFKVPVDTKHSGLQFGGLPMYVGRQEHDA